MFDFENPFKVEEDEILEEATPNWEDAEWEDVCDDPEHQAEGRRRFAEIENFRACADKEKQELFENFHAKSARRRRERIQIDALRYAGIAMACGLLAYFCGSYCINWLAWILGCIGGVFAIISSYGFGIAKEMSR